MSHFTVVVVGSDVEEQMEPYAEQEAKEEFLQFEDTEDESLEAYKNKEVDIVVLADGSLHNKYEEQFRQYDSRNFNSEYIYPEDSTMRKGKFTELYATFEEFMEMWHGTKKRDEKTGRYGYWNNPNAKWDWYSVGGRWTGYFKPKAGAVGELGQPGAFNNQPKSGYVDVIQLKDIDIEGMKKDAEKEANETYDKIEKILMGRKYPSWKEIREKHGDENIDAAREEFNNHEVVQDFNKNQFYIFGDFYEEYGQSREEYVNKCKNGVMVPYAVVKDGKWYQKGEMGWFGMSSDEMTQDEWNQHFWDLMNSLAPETELTLLDCHI
jgi:hypothetical protein